MAVQKISRSFKDISLFFDPHPVTNDIQTLSNERAINRSVRNLVETIPTERFFNSSIGSDVRKLLFDQPDITTLVVIEKQIKNIIENYEPRVTDLNISVDSTFDDNTFEVTISYTIIGQDTPSQPFTFILEAAR
jgi:phage baseplate assembly protein W